MILSATEREAFRRQAAAEHMSLSSWLREAGRRRLEERRQRPIRSLKELEAFFAALPDEEGREPDWDEHRRVIEESRRQGLTTT